MDNVISLAEYRKKQQLTERVEVITNEIKNVKGFLAKQRDIQNQRIINELKNSKEKSRSS